jgi:Protein of unknown function (DUF1592)/Protein of unknown function (DUF1588)/Protein of unknown function (DUF1595)/Protein of unknown function (DUF1585)/Protein of unknown function (DUF1587)
MRTLFPYSVAFAGLLFGCTGVLDGSQGSSSKGGPGDPLGGPNPLGGSAGSSTSSSGGASAAALVATPRIVRLSRPQWENAVRDLLQLDDIAAVTSKVTGDALVGLDNEAEALHVDPQLRADLEAAATALADKVALDPAALARLIPTDAPASGAERSAAFIRAFGARAYRRPLADAEVSAYQALFTRGASVYPADDAFIAGAKLVLSAFLQSPHFMYRTELSTAVSDGRVPLSDYEVASKLALALAGTMPDAELFAAAAGGKLHDKVEVGKQAERLLTSVKGGLGVDHLHFQMYRLGTYDGIVRNPQSFPEFSADTPAAMREEVLKFLRYVFEQGQGVAGIFTTPVGFVNSTLAPLYGVTAPAGQALTRVDLNPSERSGLLTLAGFLSSYAVVDDPDSIHRGVFVNQRILCVELPPPDPKATVLKPLDAGMTNRERVEATTGPGTCGAGCHSTMINPPGFAFEHFDAVGKFRAQDRGKPVNSAAAYQFSEGVKSFDGAVEFSHLLAESPQAHSCYLQNWLGYINGHPFQAAEQPVLDSLTQDSLAGKLPLRDAVIRIVTADGFLNRLP